MGWRDKLGGDAHGQDAPKPVAEQVVDLRRQGQMEAAWQLIEPEVRRRPQDTELSQLFWDLAVQLDRAHEASKSFQKVIAYELGVDPGLGVFHWFELVDRLQDPPEIELSLRIALAEAMTGTENEDSAADLLARAHENLPADTPLPTRIGLAKAAARCRSASTEELVGPLLADPQVPEAHRGELAQLLQWTRQHGLRPPPGQWDQAPIELSETMTMDRKLQVIAALPRALDGETITIEVADQARRRLKLAAVQALGSGVVDTGDGDAFVVVDLLVDSIWSDKQVIRTVRFRSNQFDARAFLPEATDPQLALVEMINNILAVSQAHPLPDPEAAAGRPFRSFGSMREYEMQVLDMTST